MNVLLKPHSHLEEALHILQDVDTAVAEVVLLRHSRTGALHQVLLKTPLAAFTHLPLHLQVPKQTDPTISIVPPLRTKIIFHQENWTISSVFSHYSKRCLVQKQHCTSPKEHHTHSEAWWWQLHAPIGGAQCFTLALPN